MKMTNLDVDDSAQPNSWTGNKIKVTGADNAKSKIHPWNSQHLMMGQPERRVSMSTLDRDSELARAAQPAVWPPAALRNESFSAFRQNEQIYPSEPSSGLNGPTTRQHVTPFQLYSNHNLDARNSLSLGQVPNHVQHSLVGNSLPRFSHLANPRNEFHLQEKFDPIATTEIPETSISLPRSGLSPSVNFSNKFLGLNSSLWALPTANRSAYDVRNSTSNSLLLEKSDSSNINRLGSDQTVPRNCSDLIRSMAAKYNSQAVMTQLNIAFTSSFRQPQSGNESSTCRINSQYPTFRTTPFALSSPVELGSIPRIVAPSTRSSKINSNGVNSINGALDLPYNGKEISITQESRIPAKVTSITSAEIFLNMVKSVNNIRSHYKQREDYRNHVSDHVEGDHRSPQQANEVVQASSSNESDNIGKIFIRKMECSQNLCQKRPLELPYLPLDLSPSITESASVAKRPRLDSEQEEIDVEGDAEKFENSLCENTDKQEFSLHQTSENNLRNVAIPKIEAFSPLFSSVVKNDSHPESWTVDEVYLFVKSIDICSEYAEKFKEQRIDGCGLCLLTEAHLTATSYLGMKLGPALKLRAMLAARGVSINKSHQHNGDVVGSPVALGKSVAEENENVHNSEVNNPTDSCSRSVDKNSEAQRTYTCTTPVESSNAVAGNFGASSSNKCYMSRDNQSFETFHCSDEIYSGTDSSPSSAVSGFSRLCDDK